MAEDFAKVGREQDRSDEELSANRGPKPRNFCPLAHHRDLLKPYQKRSRPSRLVLEASRERHQNQCSKSTRYHEDSRVWCEAKRVP